MAPSVALGSAFLHIIIARFLSSLASSYFLSEYLSGYNMILIQQRARFNILLSLSVDLMMLRSSLSTLQESPYPQALLPWTPRTTGR